MPEKDGDHNLENGPQKSFDELLLWLELERKLFENYWRAQNTAKKREFEISILRSRADFS